MKYLLVLAVVLAGCGSDRIESAKVEYVMNDGAGCWCCVRIDVMLDSDDVFYKIPCQPTTEVGSVVKFQILPPQ